jgi:amino acid adenylation domain-containing protein/non-ribosomal peptide synthase protein (TIGR01720 family)
MKASDYTILATSERYRDAVTFWRKQLADAGDLTGAFARTGATSRSGNAAGRVQRSIPLGPRALSALAAIASDDVGAFTVMTAGIALATARYANRPGVLIRTPLMAEPDDPAGRSADTAARLNETNDVVLTFVGAGASDESSGATIGTFLEAAAAVVEDSYTFQDFPVATLALEDCRFDLATVDVSLWCEVMHGAAAFRRSPLHFTVTVGGPSRIDIDVDPAGIDVLDVDSLAAVVAYTLEQFDSLSTPIRAIERMPPDERQRVLFEWNRTGAPAAFRAVHELFEDRVAAAPEAIAVRWGDDAMSYRDLNARANRLAHYLSTSDDAGHGQLVGIWMDRSPWMVAAVLGILKAGRAYVPIDADTPAGRVEFIVQDAGITHLLVDAGKDAVASSLGCAVTAADRDMPGADANLSWPVGATDLAYVIYTSGSTGRPKGCAIEHHSLTNYLRWANGFYWTSPDAGSMALFTPLSFDLTVPSLFCPLLRGRTLVVFPHDMPVQDALARQFAAGSGVDSVKLTPSHIRVLETQSIARTDVRLVVVGGEALTPGQVAVLDRIEPRIRLVNEYGPTEATVGCVVKDVTKDAPIVIGRPIANTQAYVLDAGQAPVAVGVRGELCIGGDGVARGYLGRPELDAERFLRNPFAPGGRMYRTGDIARWLPDGDLECFGRIDDQVKVRGYRIEPGEVEAALRLCHGVRQAVVTALGDDLIAYVVSDTGVDAAALRETLGQRVPAYMVPTIVIGLAELPLTANGKVDRRRLPLPSSPASLAARAGRPHVAPRTERERVMAGIWAEVLRRDGIGVDDDFYDVGGHSLRAMAMARRIHDATGLEVSIGEILAHPTIAGLATLLESREPTAARRIAHVADAEHYAVSHGQRRLWLIDRIEEASPAYNVSSAFDLTGPLDRDALAHALDALVARHESLRTVFVEVADEPRQKVLPALRVPLTSTDLRAEADPESRLRALVAEQAAAPFDLATGPLLRVALYQIDDARAVLSFTIHHIVSDAWSMRLVIADLIRSYDGYRSAGEAALPSLAIQYRDYAAWQRHELDSGGMREHQSYWLAKLAGPLPVLDVPADFARPPVPTYRGHVVSVTIDAATAANLRAWGIALGASTFMTLVAVVKTLLFRYTRQTDIRIGSPIAGRSMADTADQIGFFVNTLVLRDTISGAETFGDLVTRVKRTAEDGYEHQAFPFDRLLDELNVPRDLSRSPLFDVMVVHDSEADDARPSGGLTVTELRLDSGTSKFDLTFAFAESSRGIDVEIEYRTDLFTRARVETMAAQLVQVAGQVASDAAIAIDQIEITALDRITQSGAAAVQSSTSPASGPPVYAPVAPRDERELLLVGVLESVLGRSGLGMTDNFFHVGGDSIRAIQVVNRLGRLGWRLRVRDLFEAPEIEVLAKRLARAESARRGEADRRPAQGDVPLTPIQQWFFKTQTRDRAHFNQSVMLRFPDRIDEQALRSIGRALTERHASLRLQYQFDHGAIRQSYNTGADPAHAGYDPVEVHDLGGEPDPVDALGRLAAAAQAGFDLAAGRLAKVLLFRLSDEDRVLIVIHHLAVDGVSWRILLDDLRAGLAATARGDRIDLAAPTDSYQAWSLALQARAREATAEEPWWRAVDAATSVALPADAAGGDARESDAADMRFTLGVDETTALVSRVNQAYNTRPQDVLLAALAGAVRDWAGPGAVKIDIESHGRDGLDEQVDVSRTVGWFTALYPVVIDIGAEEDPGRQLVAAKDTLRRTPGQGLGYGLLRGGAPSGAAVLFNFLGQFDTDVADLDVAGDDRGPEFGPSIAMTHALVIGGWIADGRLTMTVRFSRRRFSDATIERLVAAYTRRLGELIAHCRARATRERTISDFRYTDASTGALLHRLGVGRVEDVYPLSPMQLGMLYHATLDADAHAGAEPSEAVRPAYLETFSYDIRGPLDVGIFRAVWERTIAQHTALRTAFFWHDVVQPVQVVFSQVEAPWTLLDWRALAADEQAERLSAFAASNRRHGLALDSPPLVRFALIRLAESVHRFFWTAHHLIIDGWSTAIVIEGVMADYQAAVAGAPVAHGPARPFGDYIDWLSRQDAASAAAYWRSRLEDFTTPTPLPAAGPARGAAGPLASAERRLSRDATATLERVAREHCLTLNTVARGAWAVLLAAHAHRHDVVFGATLAGRPADLPGVESMVGLFINTLPIRVRVDDAATVVAWLHRLQAEQASIDQHAFGSLADIQKASGVPPRTALFNSVLVFENYPVDESIDGASAVTVEEQPAVEETNYPLTLMVVPGDELLIRMSYDTSRYDRAAALALLGELESTFEKLTGDPQQPVGALLGRNTPHGAGAAERLPAARHAFSLDASLMATLGAVAERESSDVASVIDALIAVLAFRYATHEDLACALGVRTLSRDRFAGDDDFGAALRAVASRAGDASIAGEAATAAERTDVDLRFILTGVATSAQPSVEVRCETGRFDEVFLRRVESHLVTLAAAAGGETSGPIARLPLIPAAERAQLLDDFNRTDKSWGPEQTIVQYFETQAAAHADRCALRLPAIGRDDGSRDMAWTYGELNARANQLAHWLVREHGVGPNVRVGVLAERSLEMVLALVAIEKAGGAYVPLDPDYPRDLLHFMIDDSGAAVILADARFQELAAGRSAPVVGLNLISEELVRERVDNLPSRASGDDLAYVIYTSGSTGRPKGAMNTHRAIANRLLWMQDTYGLTERDRVLQKTPFSFDVSVWEFFWPLIAGAQLVIARPGGHRDTAYLVALLNDAEITTLHFVPSMLQAFIEEPGVAHCRSLTRVICSGEAVTPELLRRYLATLDVPLYNLYGPTEAAVDVTAWPLTAADTISLVPIGRPIANIQLYILHDRPSPAPLDDRLQLAPLGVTGELFIGGVGVGRGYLNRDELTAAKFIADPFRPAPGARLYRTGDLARYRADGVVDFLGRIDHQVKLRGFRIELGEIEAALLSHPAIRESVVVVREDQPGMKRLVGYVVLAPGVAAVPPDVGTHLAERLPSHMVPGVIVPLDALPRLTNGKLDRKALPLPEARRTHARRYVAPRDAIERRLVRVWEDVLAQTMIGVTDDFFERGGHSILAMKLVSAVQLEFGRSVPLAQLLSHPTIERLAVALKRPGDDLEDWRPLVEIRAGRGGPPLFLLPGAGGNVIYFHALAASLETTRPIFALQATGLDGRTAPLTTVEAIAAANIGAMRAAYPAGPYLIAGHSFGGRVALEMAQQLHRQGEEVAWLGVLDTVAPTFQPADVGAGWTDAMWLAKIARELEEFFGIELGVTAGDLAPLTLDAALMCVIDRMQRAGAWAPGADPAQLRGYLQVYKTHTQAAFVTYDADVARVPVALFKALERDADIDATPAGLEALQAERDWGWQRFAEGAVQVFDVPGAHLSMLTQPHVRALARALDAALLAMETRS